MRLIDADALKRELIKAFNCENATKYGNKDAKQQEQSYSTIILYEVSDIIEDAFDNAPTVPLPDFKEGYKQAIIEGKTNFSRPKGEWRHYEGFLTCSVCGVEFDDDIMEHFLGDVPQYCPECGADLRGG